MRSQKGKRPGHDPRRMVLPFGMWLGEMLPERAAKPGRQGPNFAGGRATILSNFRVCLDNAVSGSPHADLRSALTKPSKQPSRADRALSMREWPTHSNYV